MLRLIERIENLHTLSDKEILKKHNGNNFFAYHHEPSSKILLMAHVDIVQRVKKVFKKINRFVYQMTGADDRLGVSIIEHLIDSGYRFNYLLTNYEETGGLGAQAFIETKPNLEHIHLIVALDRRGSSHYVKYSNVKNIKELDRYLKQIGLFEEGNGSYSDCKIISEYSKIAHINIATGYHLEHTEQEYFNINETEYCLYVVKNILEKEPNERFEIKEHFVWNSYKYDIFDKFYNYKKKKCEYVQQCFEELYGYKPNEMELSYFEIDNCKDCMFLENNKKGVKNGKK